MATKKTSTKRISAKKEPAKTSAVKKTAANRVSKTTAGKKSIKSAADNYTRPELREKVKNQVMAGDKGGKPGQWSARKAQLVAHEYEAQGGGYKHPRNKAQNSLKQWGDEHWHTADGKQAIQKDETHRYLPDAAWNELSPKQRKSTDRKKVEGSKRGEQYVANTGPAASARKRATRVKV